MGFGFIGIIHSDDHDPPHMRICDLDKKELGQICLSSNIPRSANDIKTYRGNVDKVKNNIVEWANGKTDLGFNNWLYSFSIWYTYQEDQLK
jgi:hypothetical protein